MLVKEVVYSISNSRITKYAFRDKNNISEKKTHILPDHCQLVESKKAISMKSACTLKKYIENYITVLELYVYFQAKTTYKIDNLLTFTTLTLSSQQKHDDKEIKRNILQPFIQYLQKNHNLISYFWCAETQVNGNIHFHLLGDLYIHHLELRELWNSFQNRLGYIDDFEKEHKHRNPNSTDIHKLNDVKRTVSYIVKYMTKNKNSRAINGRLVGCSDNVKLIKSFVVREDINLELRLLSFFKDKQKYCTLSDFYESFRGLDIHSIESILAHLFPDFVSHYLLFLQLIDNTTRIRSDNVLV